jgi:hypothetical protein
VKCSPEKQISASHVVHLVHKALLATGIFMRAGVAQFGCSQKSLSNSMSV